MTRDRRIPARDVAAFLGLAVVALDANPIVSVVRAQEMAADTLAAQVRLQGHRCAKTLGAERDAQLSKPDSVVWTLRCEGAVYRVRLMPHMAANVERIE